MKKFLCYDTNDAASGKINVDSRGMLKPNSTIPTGGAPYQQLVTDGDGNARWEDKMVVDSELSDTSTNPVQNKAIKSALDALDRFVVTFTMSENGNIASDKTFGEIFDAYKAGKKVSGVVLTPPNGWTELYVSTVNGEEIDFFAMTGALDACQYAVVHVSRTGGTSLISGLLTQK